MKRFTTRLARARGRFYDDRKGVIVWVRIDLGIGPEWVAVGNVKS